MLGYVWSTNRVRSDPVRFVFAPNGTSAKKVYWTSVCFWAEAVRDLIKFLRRDGDDHETRRFLGAANIVETDLLPILLLVGGDAAKSELFDLIIRLLVNLTTPALLIYNEQPPVEKTQSQYYLQMVSHLQKYKRAFTDEAVWKIIVDKLAEVIQAVSCAVCRYIPIAILFFVTSFRLPLLSSCRSITKRAKKKFCPLWDCWF